MKMTSRAIVNLCFICLGWMPLQAVEIQQLNQALNHSSSPFNYPLNIKVHEGKSPNQQVILCCHGYGGDSSIAAVIASHKIAPDHLIGFNFPDHNIFNRSMHPSQITYGTINEILPAVYLLKKIVVDAQTDKLSLYGFSAGGAAVINLIGMLNTPQYYPKFLSIGVNSNDIQKILNAIQKGTILLDAPLKSIEEYNAAHPGCLKDPLHAVQSTNYLKNGMNPIESISKWKGLNLSVILFYQNPDQAISNRDDALFAEKLRQMNPNGRNLVLSKSEGGHLGFHYSLWKEYLQHSD
jgi:hypothetical protein